MISYGGLQEFKFWKSRRSKIEVHGLLFWILRSLDTVAAVAAHKSAAGHDVVRTDRNLGGSVRGDADSVGHRLSSGNGPAGS